MACLTASDGAGLMYATYAFIQILTLHSDIVTTPGSTHHSSRLNGAGAEHAGLEIPSMIIVDWPDIPNRGVLWSYRSTVRMQSIAMKRVVRLLSSLRINQLYLGVDLEEDDDHQNTEKNKQVCIDII
jgi:N-acetyl-beta-hexosaminidase